LILEAASHTAAKRFIKSVRQRTYYQRAADCSAGTTRSMGARLSNLIAPPRCRRPSTASSLRQTKTRNASAGPRTPTKSSPPSGAGTKL